MKYKKRTTLPMLVQLRASLEKGAHHKVAKGGIVLPLIGGYGIAWLLKKYMAKSQEEFRAKTDSIYPTRGANPDYMA